MKRVCFQKGVLRSKKDVAPRFEENLADNGTYHNYGLQPNPPPP